MNKKTLFLTLALLLLATPIFVVNATDPSATCTSVTGNAQLDKIITSIKTLAVGIGGGITVICVVIAGIMFLAAAGAPEKMTTAKRALIGAVIGATLVAISQVSNIFTDIICKTISG